MERILEVKVESMHTFKDYKRKHKNFRFRAIATPEVFQFI